MSIPEDIDEQLSMSSFHSGSAKVRNLLVKSEFRMKPEGWNKKLLEKMQSSFFIQQGKTSIFLEPLSVSGWKYPERTVLDANVFNFLYPGR